MKETEGSARLPPGQALTHKWPVLTYGETPRADLQTWTFRCFGLVGEEVSWTWKEFLGISPPPPRLPTMSPLLSRPQEVLEAQVPTKRERR